jgi:hypothetical protein
MHRTSRFRRIVAAVALALSATVPVLLPVADAYAERATADPYAHVESTGSETCVPVHDEMACQLCRGLRLSASAPRCAGSVTHSDRPARLGLVTSRAPAPAFRIGAASPRAPPAS